MAKFKGVERPCVVCGKIFRSPQSQAHVKSCSNECGNTLRGRKGVWVVLNCKACGKQFEERECHADRRTYCSKECRDGDASYNAAKSVARLGERNPGWRGGITVKAVSSSGKAYARSSLAKESAKLSKQRAKASRAIPLWADLLKILEFYERCQRLTTDTGVPHHVDHIVPINSKHVCGLHCEANLQVIPGVENVRKGNKHWPDKP